MSENIHYISPAKLTFEDVEDLLENHKTLALSEESKKLINDCKNWLDKKLAGSEEPIYGINTGFGALCDREISKDDLSKLQENLVLSHACNVGPELPHEVIKLMLFLKAHA